MNDDHLMYELFKKQYRRFLNIEAFCRKIMRLKISLYQFLSKFRHLFWKNSTWYIFFTVLLFTSFTHFLTAYRYRVHSSSFETIQESTKFSVSAYDIKCCSDRQSAVDQNKWTWAGAVSSEYGRWGRTSQLCFQIGLNRRSISQYTTPRSAFHYVLYLDDKFTILKFMKQLTRTSFT